MSEELDRLDEALAGDPRPQVAALRERAARLRGVLTFTLHTEYHERLTVFDEHLRGLQGAIDVMTEQYESFVRVRQAALHSYEGYEVPIRRLRTRVREALGRVGLLMARQGHVLELVAVNELMARRQRLDNYRDQARYALADSFDRATKARAVAEQELVVSQQAADEPELTTEPESVGEAQ